MTALSHDEAFRRLSDAVAGALSMEEDRALSTHAAACEGCGDELAVLQDLTAELRALPTPEPSDTLLERVRRQLSLELASRSDERLDLMVLGFLLVFSWSITVIGFVVFRLLTGEGLSLVGALSGDSLSWSLTYFGVLWVGGVAAVVSLAAYARKRRLA